MRTLWTQRYWYVLTEARKANFVKTHIVNEKLENHKSMYSQNQTNKQTNKQTNVE